MDSAERMNLLVGVWQNSSIELARLSEANGIGYFHFLQPNQYDEGAKKMGVEERRLAFRADHPYREGARVGYPLLREAGEMIRREGDAFFDFSRIFEDVPERLFADDCCHLTSRGYTLFADAIVQAISDKS